jgi:hypothetical protein
MHGYKRAIFNTSSNLAGLRQDPRGPRLWTSVILGKIDEDIAFEETLLLCAG